MARITDTDTVLNFPVLIGDIGGTNARFAILIDSYAEPKEFPVVQTADFATIDPASPERRESHAFSILGDIAVMHAGRTDCGLANDTWVLDLLTFTWQRINNSFTGMTCFRSGRQDCMMPGAKKCG